MKVSICGIPAPHASTAVTCACRLSGSFAEMESQVRKQPEWSAGRHDGSHHTGTFDHDGLGWAIELQGHPDHGEQSRRNHDDLDEEEYHVRHRTRSVPLKAEA